MSARQSQAGVGVVFDSKLDLGYTRTGPGPVLERPLQVQREERNMAGFRASERIDRPPEEVFEYVTDLENLPRWLPAVTRVEVITEGPVSVGTRFRETRVARGREGQAEMEVTAYDPPHTYSTAFAEGGYHATYHYSFKAEDSGTQVELKCVVGGRGLKRLMVPIVAWAMRRQDENQLASLKLAIEGED